MATSMVQGCISDAGEHKLVAGLCCVFKRHSLHVVPFKLPNMVLNSALLACSRLVAARHFSINQLCKQQLKRRANALEQHRGIPAVLRLVGA